MKNSIETITNTNKSELKKMLKILEKDSVDKKDVPKISNQTLEQMERAQYGFPKKLNYSKSSSGDKSICSNFKILEKTLKRAKIKFVPEDGEYWIKILKADTKKLSAISVTLKKSTATRKQQRTLPTLSSLGITKEDWVAVGYCKKYGSFYVWYANEDLFFCNKEELKTMPEFIRTYFNSKYGNGLLAH